MGGSVLDVEEIEWKGVPIKYCEFKRACKDFIAMDRADMEYIIMNECHFVLSLRRG